MKNVFGILIFVLILLPLILAIIATIIGIDLMEVFGWLGDEIGFVFVMVLWTYITVYFAWNVDKDAFEFDANPLKKSGDSGFFICFGVIYSLLIIVLPNNSTKHFGRFFEALPNLFPCPAASIRALID